MAALALMVLGCRREGPMTPTEKWLAAEEEIGDPMAGLRPPHVPGRPVPVFAGGDLPRLERACAGSAATPP
jgi:hypothetical protein